MCMETKLHLIENCFYELVITLQHFFLETYNFYYFCVVFPRKYKEENVTCDEENVFLEVVVWKIQKKIKITKSDAFPQRSGMMLYMRVVWDGEWGLYASDFRERLWLKNFFPFYWTFLSCQTIWVIINVPINLNFLSLL